MRVVRTVAWVAMATLSLAGCGDDGDGGTAAGGGTQLGFGEPGDPTEAERTVEVVLVDERRYEPDAISVRPGETVTFRLRNQGGGLHEFLLGDEEAHDAHEREMMEMDMEDMNMGDEVNLRSLEAGQEKVITWRFPDEEGTVLYGCHVPGHYDAGMRGTVTIG